MFFRKSLSDYELMEAATPSQSNTWRNKFSVTILTHQDLTAYWMTWMTAYY